MRKSAIFTMLSAIILLYSNSVMAQQTTLLLLPTVHTTHAKNPKYSFAHVMKIVENFKPDIIAVEIRPEDMDMDSTFLKQFYQPEMIMAKYAFPGIPKYGIDDQGKDLWGKHISLEFNKDTTTDRARSSAVGRLMNRDTAIANAIKRLGLPAMAAKRNTMMATLSANELMDGSYDAITNEYFTKLQSLVANTPYASSPAYTSYRDQKLSINIAEIVKKNPGKRIVVLSGANHHNWYVINMSKMPNVTLVTTVKDN